MHPKNHPQWIGELAARLGQEKVQGRGIAEYGADASHAPPHPPEAVVFPETEEDVVSVVRFAEAKGIPITPRGTGTGKSGGAIPCRGGIVLSCARMNRIVSISERDMIAVVEPGVVTGELQRAVEAKGRFYPPDPASLHRCTIGGNVAENAGGPRALKYGVTRDYVLGVRLVAGGGVVHRLGKRSMKGVAGYDLTALVVGSEGTLGVVTEITLRLLPLPRPVATFWVVFADLSSAANAVVRISDMGILPATLEFLDERALSETRPEAPFPIPASVGGALILELDGAEAADPRLRERLYEHLRRLGAESLHIATDPQERARIWETRRIVSRVLSGRFPHKISEDVAVPLGAIPDLVEDLHALAGRYGLKAATYGHAGDGNIHVNLLCPDAAGKRRAEETIVPELFTLTLSLGGTLSGEHGIGLTKAPFLPMEHSPELIALQQRIKAQFDPCGIFNPGKIFPPS
ncbi:MAG: FAD-binding protein [Deltaproteobacteria bacterium]|nr:MAG: FAD-binding protein [Deltaproteobacteria bacterium]